MMPSFVNISSHVWTFRFESFQTPVSSGSKSAGGQRLETHPSLSPSNSPSSSNLQICSSGNSDFIFVL